MNNNQISTICDAFGLGIAINDAIPVSGGLIHRMWKINTSRGSFAIKELDSVIMARPKIHESYIRSEEIAAILKSKKIPVATALMNQSTPLYEIDGLIVMVFPWVEGKILMLNQITTKHAKQIGVIAAEIHAANIKSLDLPIPEISFIPPARWRSLIDEALNNKLIWAAEADADLSNFIILSDSNQKAKQRLNKHLIVSHKDMDPKNVLWRNDTSPVLIDWEGAGLINPSEEIINIAIEWAGMTEILFRENIFSAVIEGYCSRGGQIIETDLHDALYGLIGGCLSWLEFNMYRSLESSKYDVDAQKLGMEETKMTLKKLSFLAKNIDNFIQLVQR